MLLIPVFDLIHLCPASMWAETPVENEEEPRILLTLKSASIGSTLSPE